MIFLEGQNPDMIKGTNFREWNHNNVWVFKGFNYNSPKRKRGPGAGDVVGN
jgi:hypothetical protein